MRRLVQCISKQMGETEFMQKRLWDIMKVAAEEICSVDCVECMSEVKRERQMHEDALWRTLHSNQITLVAWQQKTTRPFSRTSL